MSEYLSFNTFRQRQPDVKSQIFEELMQGFKEVGGGGGITQRYVIMATTVAKVCRVNLSEFLQLLFELQLLAEAVPNREQI
jgi:hypothetical protein